MAPNLDLDIVYSTRIPIYGPETFLRNKARLSEIRHCWSQRNSLYCTVDIPKNTGCSICGDYCYCMTNANRDYLRDSFSKKYEQFAWSEFRRCAKKKNLVIFRELFTENWESWKNKAQINIKFTIDTFEKTNYNTLILCDTWTIIYIIDLSSDTIVQVMKFIN